MGNSVITPAVVIRPILLVFVSANQRFPSDPPVMPDTPRGQKSCPQLVGRKEHSVITPAVVIRLIVFVASVTQRFPSEPAAMPLGPLVNAAGVGYLVFTTAV